MAIGFPNEDDVGIVLPEDDRRQLVAYDGGAAALNKSEVEAQLDAAHKYRRVLATSIRNAIQMATLTPEISEGCIYTLERRDKKGNLVPIVGPSIRLAEIVANAWGNIHFGGRIVDITDKETVAQGVCWCLETNTRATVEARRRITGKTGRRYSEDMITVTGMAAISIALRNAIFRVVPRAYVDAIFEKVKEKAVGKAEAIAAKRKQILDRLSKIGVSEERVLHALGKTLAQEIGREEIAILIGWGNAIKDGERTLDDVFPEPLKEVPGAEQEGRRMPLGRKAAAEPANEPEPVEEEIGSDPPLEPDVVDPPKGKGGK